MLCYHSITLNRNAEESNHEKLISCARPVLSLSLIACGAKQDDTPQTGADTPDTTQTAEKQKLIVGFDAEDSAVRLHRRRRQLRRI